MTIQQMTLCNLIQTFPVLLILAQRHNTCLETPFVYKPPSPTQSPEYYQALDALFQNLYGHGYPGHGAHDTQPCYYSSSYGTKPCYGHDYGSHGPSYGHGSYGTNYGSHGTPYGSHGTHYGSHGTHGTSYGSHGTGYGSHGTHYGSHGTSYGSHGTGYGLPGSYYGPGYKKGNIYKGNVTYGQGYASNVGYTTNNRYKIVVKKTKLGTKRKRKSGKLRADAHAEACTAVNGGAGTCVSLQTCQPYLEVMRDAVSNPTITWMLRQAHCGFDGNIPKVCCPIDDDQNDEKENQIEHVTQTTPSRKLTSTLPPTTSTLPPTTSTSPPTMSTSPPKSSTLPPTTSSSPPTVTTTRRYRPATVGFDLLSLVGDTCKTVYNTTGSCKDIYLCEPILALANKARSNPAAVILLKKASCGFKGNIPQVCCPLPRQVSPPQIPDTTTVLPSADSRTGEDFITALPEPPVCGLSNISLDRVVGGVPAKLGAFPWMALLGYRDESVAAGLRWKCGGVLVSTRHVLTAAHCIHLLEDDLFIVRLGELDLAREDEGAKPIDVPVKAMFKHEMYSRNNPVINDVGVLVLGKDVQFTDLIKPICLFTNKALRSETFEHYNPFVAGWGDIKWQGIRATHLQVAQVPVLGSSDCEGAYSEHLHTKSRSRFSEQAMCAGYLSGKIDSCSGDSGGPLMQPIEVEGLSPRTYMYSIGVVSFGRKCAQAGSPGVYARVGYYMPWIEDKILGRAS